MCNQTETFSFLQTDRSSQEACRVFVTESGLLDEPISSINLRHLALNSPAPICLIFLADIFRLRSPTYDYGHRLWSNIALTSKTSKSTGIL